MLKFEMKVMEIIETRVYELSYEEKVPLIKNWFGQEGLQLIKTFTHEEKEKCTTAEGLLSILSNKFKLQHNKAVIYVQHHK